MESSKRSLLVIDVQNDFCPGGTLAVDTGDEVAARIAAYIGANKWHYSSIIASKDLHVDPSDHFSETPDFVSSWPRHCVKGTYGSELRPELRDVSFDAIVTKGGYSGAYSAFEGTTDHGEPLLELLERQEIELVYICGIATDYCVLQSALDALEFGFSVTVFMDLIAGVSQQSSLQALELLATRGANLHYAIQSG